MFRFVLILFFTIFSYSVFGVGEVVVEKTNENDPRCHVDPSPIKECPLTGESFDEFEVIECACQLPPDENALNNFNAKKNLKIGDTLKTAFGKSKENFIEVVRLSSQLGVRADHPNDNKCSMDAFSEILKRRVNFPKQSPLSCGNEQISENAQKFFGKSLGKVISDLGKAPEGVISNNDPISSLFSQPKDQRDQYQCLSEPVGNGYLDLITKGSSLDRIKNGLEENLKTILSEEDNSQNMIRKLSQNSDYFRLLSEDLKYDFIDRAKREIIAGKDKDQVIKTFLDQTLSPASIQSSIEGLQSHCGFMMSSLVDLLCKKDQVGTIKNAKFLEWKLEHDPFEINLEDENYYAAQSMYCDGQKESGDRVGSHAKDCANEYRGQTIEELSLPKIRVQQYDEFLSCHEQFLGSSDFIKNNLSREENIEKARERDSSTNLCQFMHCSNISDLANIEGKFDCKPRSQSQGLDEILNDLRKIDCSKGDNRFCVGGKPDPIFHNIQKMLLVECRMTDCMSDKDINSKLASMIEGSPELQRIMSTPRDKLVSSQEEEKRFWQRFSGETTDLAKANGFDAQSFEGVLKSDFTGKGYSERPKALVEKVTEVENVLGQSVDSAKSANTAVREQEIMTVQDEILEELAITASLREEQANLMSYRAKMDASAIDTQKRAKITKLIREARKNIQDIKDRYEAIQQRRRDEIAKYREYAEFGERFRDMLPELPTTKIKQGTSRSQARTIASVAEAFELPSQQEDIVSNSARVPSNNFDNSNNSEISKAKRSTVRTQPENREAVESLPSRVGSGGKRISAKEAASIIQGTGGASLGGLGTGGGRPASSDVMILSDDQLSILEDLKGAKLTSLDMTSPENFKAEIIVAPELEQFGLLAQMIEYRKTNPNFRVGEMVTIKQYSADIGAYLQARLIPVFDDNGKFKEYGINSDNEFKEKIIIEKEVNFPIRFLSKDESYKTELDLFDQRVVGEVR